MIYLDNSATTFRKPETVYHAVSEGMRIYGGNPGRGDYRLANETAERVYLCRENIARLFQVPSPEQVIFTKNTTEALNLAIHGILQKGDHAVIGSMEHNSVLRPIHGLMRREIITYSIAQADFRGVVTAQSVARVMTPKTKLIVINHMSNVCGSISPIDEIMDLAHRRGVVCLIDAAQSGGVLPLSLRPDTMIAFAGHKGLYGPQGTGGLCIGNEITLQPLIEGGTGSLSAEYDQPRLLPDRFESGTLPAPQLWGLCRGVEYVLSRGVSTLFKQERELMAEFRSRVRNAVRFYPEGEENCGGIAAFSVEGTDSATFCTRLDETYSIAARGGLHCAPLAHKTLGTLANGLVRFSAGAFTTPQEISAAADAVLALTK